MSAPLDAQIASTAGGLAGAAPGTGTESSHRPVPGTFETHQVKVAGRLTCVSLEYPVWRHLHRVAFERRINVSKLVDEVAAARAAGAMLSRALRLFVIADLEARAFPDLMPGRRPL
jgi:predicted DNA-binding ribbon-helix-helix protein